MSLFPVMSPHVPPPASATFVAASNNAGSATVYTYSSHAIGTADSDRKIVVLAWAEYGAVAISSVTVGGNTMTSNVAATTSTSTGAILEYEDSGALGTTSDIIVTFASGVSGNSIEVFAVTGAAATVANTASVNNDTTPDDTLDVPANGTIICGAMGNAGANPTSTTWSGVTERSDTIQDTNVVSSSASNDFTVAQTGLAFSATFNNTPSAALLLSASWAQA